MSATENRFKEIFHNTTRTTFEMGEMHIPSFQASANISAIEFVWKFEEIVIDKREAVKCEAEEIEILVKPDG